MKAEDMQTMITAVVHMRCVHEFLELDDLVRTSMVCVSWHHLSISLKVPKWGLRRRGLPQRKRLRCWLQHSWRMEGMAAAATHFRSTIADSEHRGPEALSSTGIQGTILRDVCRTFPDQPLFCTAGGVGQSHVADVLRAIALYHPEVGYCQGMNFVAAAILDVVAEGLDADWANAAMLIRHTETITIKNKHSTDHITASTSHSNGFGQAHIGPLKEEDSTRQQSSSRQDIIIIAKDEEEAEDQKKVVSRALEGLATHDLAAPAFEVMHTWIKCLKLSELWRPGVPQLRLRMFQFERLLMLKLPVLHRYFKLMGLMPDYFASQWFMTLLTYNLPRRLWVRAADLLLSEGWKTIFRFGLSMLLHMEDQLLELSLEDISGFFRNSRQELMRYDADSFVAKTMTIKISNQLLLDLEADFIQMAVHSQAKDALHHQHSLEVNAQDSLVNAGAASGSISDNGSTGSRQIEPAEIEPVQRERELFEMEMPTRTDISVLRRQIEQVERRLGDEQKAFSALAWELEALHTEADERQELKSALGAQLQALIQTSQSQSHVRESDLTTLLQRTEAVQRQMNEATDEYSDILNRTSRASLDLQQSREYKAALVCELQNVVQHSFRRKREQLLRMGIATTAAAVAAADNFGGG